MAQVLGDLPKELRLWSGEHQVPEIRSRFDTLCQQIQSAPRSFAAGLPDVHGKGAVPLFVGEVGLHPLDHAVQRAGGQPELLQGGSQREDQGVSPAAVEPRADLCFQRWRRAARNIDLRDAPVR